ncbi:acyl-CoA thioesterase [Neisseria weaveri]|uniref:acyl-CoA thioesterase n=1 Tax=Neisseria weaveri TaxID=28091 RepID=UPI000D309C3C|nr:thioesterase family protein [Neisseria weaveri]
MNPENRLPPLFAAEITVQIGDINYGNHLANDAVLRLCHEARIRWLAQHNLTELDIGSQTGIIMTDAALQYTAQARHGDILSVHLSAFAKGRSRFTITYRLIRNSDGKTIATAETGMACFHYQNQKVCKIPETFLALLQAV